MTLSYLVFDRSEDTEGTVTLDAMASVAPPQVPEVQAETDAVLAWLQGQFGGVRGPVDEGGAWDADLQVQADGPDRVMFTLTLALAADVAQALEQHFSIE